MAGYTRQSSADIVPTAVVRSAPVNAEFNQLRDAFDFSSTGATGHKHDGSSDEGSYVPLIADLDALNKVVIDTSNNRVQFFVEVSASAVEQVRIEDGVIYPVTDNDIDLGTSSLEFKNLYLDGIANIDTLIVDENATVTGNITVNGNTTLGNATTDTVTFTARVATDFLPSADGTYDLGSSSVEWQDLWIDGTANIDSLVADTADINAGTIDNTVIGATTPVAGTFTTMNATTATTSGNTTVGGNLAVTGTSTFTGAVSAANITATGTATLATVDINAGAVDGTIIGASSAAAGSFTTVNTSGQATLASVNIDGGTIDGAVIGGASAAAITGTTITANTGFTGPLTGAVTGNVTGNLTGNVTGNVTGDLTGNVTAASGTSTFNDVTINGGLNMNAGTAATITNLTTPTNAGDAATKGYVDTNDALKLNLTGGTMSGNIAMGGNTVTGLATPSASTDAATKGYVDSEVAALVDSAPAALDTLNELAAALGDDANFSTTITNSIATKLPLAGGTMSGAIAMGTNKITGLGDPTLAQDAATKTYVDTADALKLNLSGGTMSGNIAMGTNSITGLADPSSNQDAATKNYVDTQDATKLSLSGGTMTGAIDMGANKITTTYTPTDNADLTTKTYVDGILGSATSAAASAAAAATSASNAATSEGNAANSAAAAAASYDSFDDRYLGPKATAPTVDNDGNALLTGALYWDTASNELFIWDGANWQQGAFTAGSLLANIVEDTTPQLGGNLDLNGSNITGTGAIDITGTVSAGAVTYTATDGSAGHFLKTDGAGNTSFAAVPAPNNATITLSAGTALSGGGDFTTDQSGNETITFNFSGGINDLSDGYSAGGSIGLGTNALTNDDGSNNDSIAIGDDALAASVTGSNIAIGKQSLAVNTSTGNIALGKQSLFYNVSGYNNIAIGIDALRGVSGQSHNTNTAIGHQSGYFITTGTNNLFSGYLSGYWNSTGNANTNIGTQAGYYNQTGTNNVSIGSRSLLGNQYYSHSNNTAIGYEAGYSITTGGSNFFGGYQAGNSVTTGANNIVIGYDADTSSPTVSNEITLGNNSITAFRIPGLNISAASNSFTINGWTITESGGSLYFATGGSNKMKLDASGNLDVVGNVNSNATIT